MSTHLCTCRHETHTSHDICSVCRRMTSRRSRQTWPRSWHGCRRAARLTGLSLRNASHAGWPWELACRGWALQLPRGPQHNDIICFLDVMRINGFQYNPLSQYRYRCTAWLPPLLLLYVCDFFVTWFTGILAPMCNVPSVIAVCACPIAIVGLWLS